MPTLWLHKAPSTSNTRLYDDDNLENESTKEGVTDVDI